MVAEIVRNPLSCPRPNVAAKLLIREVLNARDVGTR
jgi:hypothetical protein